MKIKVITCNIIIIKAKVNDFMMVLKVYASQPKLTLGKQITRARAMNVLE